MRFVLFAVLLAPSAPSCGGSSQASSQPSATPVAMAPSVSAPAAASTTEPAAASAPPAQHANVPAHPDAGTTKLAPSAFVPPAGALGIGGGEADAHTHVSFGGAKDIVRTSVYVVVDRFAPKGLNFFALQVDFAGNHTWAHGGFQTSNHDAATPTAFNWCGLVNRGGGSKDYKQANPAADMDAIQCASGSGAVWQAGVPYEYIVERGQKVTLPPGEYSPSLTGKKYKIDHPRTLWEWWFTVTPMSGGAPIYKGVVYDSAEAVASFMVWNENGYGSQAAEQHTTWWGAKYRTADKPTVDQPPSKSSRF